MHENDDSSDTNFIRVSVKAAISAALAVLFESLAVGVMHSRAENWEDPVHQK